LGERCGVQSVQSLTATYFIDDQAALPEYTQVAAHRRAADVEAGRDLSRRHHPIPEQQEDVPTYGVRNGRGDVHGQYVTNVLRFVKGRAVVSNGGRARRPPRLHEMRRTPGSTTAWFTSPTGSSAIVPCNRPAYYVR